jgi:hypothetical protein
MTQILRNADLRGFRMWQNNLKIMKNKKEVKKPKLEWANEVAKNADLAQIKALLENPLIKT